MLMTPLTLEQHIGGPGPKRILALDGGGVRGILTLGFLQKIEALLRTRHGGDPDFRLCHYFDLIGGTSTGAIIAAGLATGMSVAELLTLYRGLARLIFEPAWYRPGIIGAKFPSEPLRQALEKQFRDIRLGGSEVLTGLMIMAKRLDTGSPWVLHNNPKSKYYNTRPGSTAFPNKNYRLRRVVRASTAAPHYFEPERIKVTDDLTGAFVDGGISPHNNPALQLFMLATLEGYQWKWKTGADDLLIVSAGTGEAVTRLDTDKVMSYPAADLARRALLSLMDDCSALDQIMLQWMSRSPTKSKIDSEIGDLANDKLGGLEFLTYLRYDVKFEERWIHDVLGETITAAALAELGDMDKPENLAELERIGVLAAAKQISDDHFPAAFDLKNL